MLSSRIDKRSLALLQDQRIIVTGAASGIGLGSARTFQAFGAKLFLADCNADALAAAAADLDCQRVKVVDVTEEVDCERLAAEAKETLGGLDGVFHAAGISDAVEPALSIPIDAWQKVVDVNLHGTFLVARAAARHMVPLCRGSIVTVSSVNGINGIPRRHAYGPAKAAIAQLTRTLACEWGTSSVRVNALAPTYIRTPMIERLEREGKIDIGRLERRTPMGRIGEVDEVAHAAAFLLSDLSAFVTGVVLPVDGGWLAYGGPGDVASA